MPIPEDIAPRAISAGARELHLKDRMPPTNESRTQWMLVAFACRCGRRKPPMDDRDRRELRALCAQFRELMQHGAEEPLFDQQARRRIGEVIGRSLRRGGSPFAYAPEATRIAS